MSGWRRLLCVPLAIAVAIGLALHVAQTGTVTLVMELGAPVPTMADCDGCGDAAAPAACDSACAPALAALLPPRSGFGDRQPVQLAAPRAAGLVGLADPPDPHPPRRSAHL